MKTLTLALIAIIAAIMPASVPSLPQCATEDSTGCYWDAAHRGNMQGKSFYTTDAGTTVYLEGK